MAAGQTVVSYGDVTIHQCHTKRFLQEPIFDDSGTDLMYYRFTVRIVGYLHDNTYWAPVKVTPLVGANDAAQQHVMVRNLIGEPRKSFEMRLGADTATGLGGTVLLSANPYPPSTRYLSGLDINNGPRCTAFEITNIAANHVLRVEAEFEICKVECDQQGGADGNASGILSNRWSVVDEVDQNFYTTRTWNGRLRIASAQLNAHIFRSYVVPTLQPGMRRDRMIFSASADGLNLDYTIIDKEVAFAPPAPATSWHFAHTVETQFENTKQNGSIDVTLAGDRLANKSTLVRIAFAAATAKLSLQNPGGPLIVNRVILTDEYGDNSNSIHLHVDVTYTADQDLFNGYIYKDFAKPLDQTAFGALVAGYDSNFSRGARAGETIEVEGPVSMMAAFAAYLQTPCNFAHNINDVFLADDLDEGFESPEATMEARVYDDLPTEANNLLSEDHRTAMYLYWQMESSYHTNGHKVHVPIAASAIGSTGSASAVVTLARPTAKRVVRLTSKRVGARPLLPAAQDYNDPNGIPVVLLDSKVLLPTFQYSADGKVIHELSAEFTYAMERPLTAADQVLIGHNPWSTAGLETDTISNFTGGTA